MAKFEKVNTEKETYSIELPTDMTGIFIVKTREKSQITLNGKSIKSAEKLDLNLGKNRVIIEQKA